MSLNLFIIGDVHGCFHTFSALLHQWNPATEHLIQVGDLVDRGAYSPETVELARSLADRHPATTTFLMGNHEHGLLRHFGPAGPYPEWLGWGGHSTVEQYQRQPALLASHLPWIARRPLLWQNKHVLVSHAGRADVPLAVAQDRDSSDGLLWARGPLKRLRQLQVVGHTPLPAAEPLLDHASNTLYIDTGAVFGGNLAGVRLSPTGAVLETVLVPVVAHDSLEIPRARYLSIR